MNTTSTCTWTATSPVPWVTLDRAGGTGSGNVRATVLAQDGFTSRQASLTIAGQAVVLDQEGLAACVYALSPASQTVGETGGTAVVELTTQNHCAWTAASSDEWLTVTDAVARQGSGSIACAIAPNATRAERRATVSAGGTTAEIVQRGLPPCAVRLTPTREEFGPGGGAGFVDVATEAGCSWAATPDSHWIRVSSVEPPAHSGSGRVRYEVDANDGNAPRDGRLRIADQALTVTQRGLASCEYTVDRASFTLHWHDTGGHIRLSTAEGCPWTADTEESWITLGSRNGLGPATIAFSVPPLTANQVRNGAVRLRWPTPAAGQNIWILHEGCRYGVASMVTVPRSGGRYRVDVLTQPISSSCPIGCTWSAVPDAPWVTVVWGSPNAGDNPFTIDVAPNTTGTERTATITVADVRTIVRQAG